MPPPLAAKDADAPPGSVRVHAFLPTAERRRGRLATIISFLLHALIIYIAIRLTADVALPQHSPIGDAIQLALGGGGGGGGQGGPVLVHPVTPPPAVMPPPVQPPPPTVIPPPPTPQPVPPPAAVADAAPASTVAAAGTGAGSGGGNGIGTGTGNGSGQGPGSGSGSGGGSGAGNGASPPENRSLTIPQLNAPKRLRGKSVEVTFRVAVDGRVTEFSIDPPIDDRDYAKKFDEIIREFRFKPAKDAAGKPIPGTTTMVFTF